MGGDDVCRRLRRMMVEREREHYVVDVPMRVVVGVDRDPTREVQRHVEPLDVHGDASATIDRNCGDPAFAERRLLLLWRRRTRCRRRARTVDLSRRGTSDNERERDARMSPPHARTVTQRRSWWARAPVGTPTAPTTGASR